MRRQAPEGADREVPPLPLRATAIVLGAWVFGLVILAFGVVPFLFGTCAPPAAAP